MQTNYKPTAGHLCKMKDIRGSKDDWNETKRKLKEKFALLTGNDVLMKEGQQEELISRLQIKLGKTREEIKKIISEL